jgi:hypothetical protein
LGVPRKEVLLQYSPLVELFGFLARADPWTSTLSGVQKLIDLMGINREVAWFVRRLEFQQRTAPHFHLCVAFSEISGGLLAISEIDSFMTTTPPDPKHFPDLYAMVMNFMVHDCEKTGYCQRWQVVNGELKKLCRFGYEFAANDHTYQGDDGKIVFARGAENGRIVAFTGGWLLCWGGHTQTQIAACAEHPEMQLGPL